MPVSISMIVADAARFSGPNRAIAVSFAPTRMFPVRRYRRAQLAGKPLIKVGLIKVLFAWAKRVRKRYRDVQRAISGRIGHWLRHCTRKRVLIASIFGGRGVAPLQKPG